MKPVPFGKKADKIDGWQMVRCGNDQRRANNVSPRRPDAMTSRTPVAREDAAILPTFANCLLLRASHAIDQGEENTLSPVSPFPTKQVHDVLQKSAADIYVTSAGRDWTSIFASMQREYPFNEMFGAVSSCLMVIPRGIVVTDVTYKLQGRTVTRHIPHRGLFFLPAGSACEVDLRNVLDTIHIYLPPGLFSEQNFGARVAPSDFAPILGERDAVLEHLGAAIAEIMQEDAPRPSLLVDIIAHAIAARLFAVNSDPKHTHTPSHRRLGQKQIERLRDFVSANLTSDITLASMAAVCGLNNEEFMRAFKATAGISPYQYVLALRIARARDLLCDPSWTLPDIAAECGFSHQQHLTSTFRRFTGRTPAAYRRGA
jgi:AraC family transcriptional regulator